MSGKFTPKNEKNIWVAIAEGAEQARLGELKRIMSKPSMSEVSTMAPYYPADLFNHRGGTTDEQFAERQDDYKMRGGVVGEKLRQTGMTPEQAFEQGINAGKIEDKRNKFWGGK